MTAKQIFKKTRPFCMAKMALGAITVLLSTIVFLILLGIGWLFGDGGIFVEILLWVGATVGIRKLLMNYVGYLVKAGHIAVIAEAMKTGQVPKDQVEYGKTLVQQRFLTSNVYFVVDKLVSGAVKQIQRGLEKLGNKLDFVPGMEALTGVAKIFVDISLGYVDECCFGWTFYNPQQGAFESAADAVVIYAQNWKVVLKGAAKTMLKVAVGLVGIVLAIFIPIGILFKIFKWSALVAFVLACLLTWIVKFAFIDSYMMCQMMVTYMEVAPTTQLTFDLYGQLSKISSSFRELRNKAAEEGAAQPQAYGAAPQMAGTAQMETAKPVFCGNCGAKIEGGTKFCGECGNKLG